jgi:hypothetical protein
MADTNPSSTISPFLSSHVIGQCAKELSDAIKFPVQTANLATLVAASHAVGSVYSVCYPDGDVQPVPLYAIAEQPPGTGKSRLVNMLYRGYIEQGTMLNKNIQAERELVKKSIAMKSKQGQEIPENEQMLLDKLCEIPRCTTDATPQSLEKVMNRQKGFFIVAGTEQNLTKTLLGGLYSDGVTVDGIINSAFNGEYSSSERASADRVTFQGRPFGGIFCLSQEGTIQTVLNSAGSSGLTERFLMLREDDLLGKRSKFPDLTSSQLSDILSMKDVAPAGMVKRAVKKHKMDAYNRYSNRMRLLAIERSELDNAELAGLKQLRFKPEAWAMIEAGKEVFERSINGESVRNSFIASMNSKIDILTMKVAATIHVMNTGNAAQVGDIDREAVFSAFFVVNELFDGVKSIAGGNKLYGDEAEDEFVIEYLISCRKAQTIEEIKRNVPRRKDSPFKFYTRRGESKAKIDECIARLEEAGKVTVDKRRKPFTYNA